METTKGQRIAIVFLLALAVGTVVWFTSADDAEPSHAPPNVPSTVQVDDRRQEGAEPRDARPAQQPKRPALPQLIRDRLARVAAARGIRAIRGPVGGDEG